jgi:UDP-MurNAc hydroxylase
MRVRYLYSACIAIETPDVRIVCDPWFTDHIYDHAWVQWPRVFPSCDAAADAIGPVDVIYLSHLHPDHYDPNMVRALLARNPNLAILSGHRGLSHALVRDGFRSWATVDAVDRDWRIGGTRLRIVPNQATHFQNIDTALAVVHGTQSIVNLNDNLFDAGQLDVMQVLLGGSRPTLACLPYAGAGPWPHTFDLAENERRAAETALLAKGLAQYQRFVDALNPEIAMPFAGLYWLAGPLSWMNPHRALPDAVVAAASTPNGLVLPEGEDSWLDLDTGTPSKVRTEPLDVVEAQRYVQSLPWPGFPWATDPEPRDNALDAWMLRAVLQARQRVPLPEDARASRLTLETDTGWLWDIKVRSDLQESLHVTVDARHLAGLLTGRYKWNHAQVGSTVRHRRVGQYDRDIVAFLEALHV